MSFTEMLFLPIAFLTAVIVRRMPAKIRWVPMLVVSVMIYIRHDARLILPLFLVTGIAYVSCRVILKYPKYAEAARIFGTALPLMILFFYKYTGTAGKAFLPAGISFYTFQAVSCVIDTGRGRVKNIGHAGQFALYVSFFPQLVAGPIERAEDLMPQILQGGDPEDGDGAEALKFLVRGYAKKCLIADALGRYVDAAYANPSAAGGAAILVATALFMGQIYCDFSGYSDIAMGCARMLGIRLSENFDRPWKAKTPREFWRRWHRTLGRWFTEYVYIPLGGSRKGKARECLNLIIVFLLSGLWHGAEWSFVVWGAMHGVYAVIETICRKEGRKPGIPAVCLTWAGILIAWVFFRAENVGAAAEILRIGFTDFRIGDVLTGIGATGLKILPVIILPCLIPMLEKLPEITKGRRSWMIYFLLILFTGLCRAMILRTGAETAFIYFQF